MMPNPAPPRPRPSSTLRSAATEDGRSGCIPRLPWPGVAELGSMIWRMHALRYSLLLAIFVAGCVRTPPAPASRLGVAFTSRNNTHLVLDRLAVEDYPALKKFHRLREGQYWWRTATDEKLEALANVGLPNLRSVSLNGSSYITDRGLAALARIPSMDGLGLEGAAVTDAGAELIAQRIHPRSVNVVACTNVTMKGLLRLVDTETLKLMSVSAEPYSTSDFVRLLDSARNLEWFHISGRAVHLDRGAIEQAAARKARARGTKLQVVYTPRGSISMDMPLPSRDELK